MGMEGKSCKGAMLRCDFEPKLQAICCAFRGNFGCVSSALSARQVREAGCSYAMMVTFVKSLYVLAVTDYYFLIMVAVPLNKLYFCTMKRVRCQVRSGNFYPQVE